MTSLWPKDLSGYTIIPYFLAGFPPIMQPNMTLVNLIFSYISDKTCVKFNQVIPRRDCFIPVGIPTICAKSERGSSACYSDENGLDRSHGKFDGEPQILNIAMGNCPFHEAVQSVARMLGLMPEHRRSDRDDVLKVTVTAAGTDRLLFAQGQTARCEDYADDSPLDLFSVSMFDTSASTLRHSSRDGMRALEHGMVIAARNIRYVCSPSVCVCVFFFFFNYHFANKCAAVFVKESYHLVCKIASADLPTVKISHALCRSFSAGGVASGPRHRCRYCH